MIRLTNLADYAVMLTARIAAFGKPLTNATELSNDTGLPVPTVAKILGMLARADILESQRGLKGGFRLARPATAISLIEVIEAVDGPLELTACVNASSCDCKLEISCEMKPHWALINRTIRAALGGVTIADVLAADVPPARLIQNMSSALVAMQ